MTYRILTVMAVMVFSFAFKSTENLNENEKNNTINELVVTEALSFKEEVAITYENFSKNNLNLPTLDVFEKGMKGYYKLKEEGAVTKKILTIVDFNLSSSKKRMWILDMENKEVLFHTYTSHGKNTGGEFAKKFSNTLNSLQSSLGFYVTGETYYGRNGLSLFIDGKEKGFNSNARKRYVVIHGADYATPNFIKKHGRLGRSYGCPAVPNSLAKELINTIKGESVVYIHKNSSDYLKKSSYLNYPTA
ncbi:murein L,D-transpeptidase catalytic domain family protein [Autumnicola psychrophila]|uniref:Murein L,D-transpeptidase catalytic domain family protein n=1 Tax=Autumnicola psychrophila TaxID=3075592 RepID=A0ABU3DMH3_9FLAO|nr:murein L,D-transpeptidase catalytic domain family protein [Zunongwangia sp. F225]MDT0684911.1 murein L,D-transpeptidase catalytic domain family protein [Zunongwangia sp. F225]